MKDKLLKSLAYILTIVGVIASGAASAGCVIIFFDEPTMPASMIE